jgi:hypothetical protein
MNPKEEYGKRPAWNSIPNPTLNCLRKKKFFLLRIYSKLYLKLLCPGLKRWANMQGTKVALRSVGRNMARNILVMTFTWEQGLKFETTGHKIRHTVSELIC